MTTSLGARLVIVSPAWFLATLAAGVCGAQLGYDEATNFKDSPVLRSALWLSDALHPKASVSRWSRQGSQIVD